MPLVFEARSWQHGTFLGSAVASEKTAAAEGDDVGQLRHDPFAMLPFCGYNMGDYFQHWLDMGNNATNKALLPKFFHVNWFRQDDSGRFLWPGFGDNAHVLKWIFERVDGKAAAEETAVGMLPRKEDLDLSGLEGSVSDQDMSDLLTVDKAAFRHDLDQTRKYHAQFNEQLPKGIV